MHYFASAGQILISVFFGALIALVVLRVLLQCVRANFYNPVCQFLYKVTNPVMMPLRKLIPAWRNLDVAGVLLAWVLTAIELALLYLVLGERLGVLGLAVMALAELIDFVLKLYFGLILVRVFLSFVSVERSNPIVPLIVQLTDPVLKRLRRFVPAVASIDLSPMVAMLIILLARVLIVAPILDAGLHLAQGA